LTRYSETASEALHDYFEEIGGRPTVTGKKRKGRKSGAETETSTPVNTKRVKKEKSWSPPPGSWETEVDVIDTVTESINEKTGEKERFVFVVWNNQNKTQHPLRHIYQKCPQKMLQYYEEHL
jgi:chromobox protein 1